MKQDTAHDSRRERNCSSVNKLGYMLESLSILSYEGETDLLVKMLQVQIISRKGQRKLESSETTRQASQK